MRFASMTRAAHLVTDFIVGSTSYAMPAPRSREEVAACAPMMMSGVPAIMETRAGVTALVTPGPRVTTAAPGLPVTRDAASAMKQAAASCRAWIKGSFWRAQAR
jgi:hypothetical protein